MSRTPFFLAFAIGLLAVPSCSSEKSEAGSGLAEVEQQNQVAAPAVLGSLAFERTEVDLGDVYQHHRYEVRYPFTVVGEGAVRVKEMATDNGFTEAHFEPPVALKEWMPVGTKAEVVVTFDAGRYSEQKETSITLRGDFQSSPNMLVAKAFVLPVFEINPAVVQFGSIRKIELEEGIHSQMVEVIGLKDFEVLGWKRTPPGVSMQALEGVKTTRGGRVVRTFRVTAGPEMTEGRTSSSFIAETDLGVDLELMVNAEVLGPVKYTPSSRVAFGIFDQGEEKHRSVKVEAGDLDLSVPLPTVAIMGDCEAVMSAEVRAVEQDREYNIVLNIGKHAAPGSYNGVLRISYPEASGLAPKEIMLNARIRSSR